MTFSKGHITCADGEWNAPFDDGATTRSVAERARTTVAVRTCAEICKTVSASARRRDADSVVADREAHGREAQGQRYPNS